MQAAEFRNYDGTVKLAELYRAESWDARLGVMFENSADCYAAARS